MKNIIITRAFKTDIASIGLLKIEGVNHPPITTLENPWLENKPFISCIPEGEYIAEPFSGKKYQAVYEIKNVPNRSHILFHHGNLAEHTHGCILLGLGVGTLQNEPAILQSRAAVKIFREIIKNNKFGVKIC